MLLDKKMMAKMAERWQKKVANLSVATHKEIKIRYSVP